jgi:hypothetical protein
MLCKRFDAIVWASFPATASSTSGTSTTSRHRTVSGTTATGTTPVGRALTLRQTVGPRVSWPAIQHLGSGQRLSLRNHTGCHNEGMPDHEARGVDVAIAEFNALRAEIVGIRNTQAALVGVALTAIGALFTLALKDPDPGDERLLLAVPPLGLIVSLLHLGESFRIHRLGDYIRDRIALYLHDKTGYDPSWERWHYERAWNLSTVMKATVFDGAVTLLLVAASISALWYSGVAWNERTALLALTATALSAIAPILFAVTLKSRGTGEATAPTTQTTQDAGADSDYDRSVSESEGRRH